MPAGIVAVDLLAGLLMGLAAFAQCGPGECADGPTGYRLLERARP